ncbi:hypothetical protein ACFUEN_29125 [Streptomyces griseorubiginosus]|uniref:hypothetical protein n=1 Tax=Streptomyces griseorubiginosus TaxID=67304 RepID=UPI0036364403
MEHTHPEPADPTDACRTIEVDGAPVHVRGAGELDEKSAAALTSLVRAATRRFAEEQAMIVGQVNELRRTWVKNGVPLGVSFARWWDERLRELNKALHVPDRALSRPGDSPMKARERWAFQFVGIVSDLDRCAHGRHEGDPCGSCGGLSTGNPYLAPGRVIGHGVHGSPIVVPTRDRKADPAAWRHTKES